MVLLDSTLSRIYCFYKMLCCRELYFSNTQCCMQAYVPRRVCSTLPMWCLEILQCLTVTGWVFPSCSACPCFSSCAGSWLDDLCWFQCIPPGRLRCAGWSRGLHQWVGQLMVMWLTASFVSWWSCDLQLHLSAGGHLICCKLSADGLVSLVCVSWWSYDSCICTMHASWWSCILHPLQLVLMLWTLLNQVRKMYSRCCMLYLCVVDNAYMCYAWCTAYLIMYIILNVHLIHTTPQHYTPHHTKPHNTSAIYTSPHHTTQHLTNIIFTTPHLTTLQHICHASLHHSTPHHLPLSIH